jgi:hypothetical protein
MRFHHAVLLAALAIAPVCAERIKVSDERGIVDSTLSAVGGVDCGGGGSGGGLRCNDVGQRVRSRGISGSRRGEQDVSSPMANPRTTIPGGGYRRAMGAVDALDCGEGGGIAGTTRTTMTRKRTSVSSPTAAAAAAATTAIARCSTAGSVATATGGTGDDDGDVEAPAVRVTDW